MRLYLNIVDTSHMLLNGPLGLQSMPFHLSPLKVAFVFLKILEHSIHSNKISFTSNISSKIFYTSREVLRYSNQSNNIFFTLNMPYTLKYLKLDLLHLKRGLKILKSLKKDVLHLQCALHSQIPQVKFSTHRQCHFMFCD